MHNLHFKSVSGKWRIFIYLIHVNSYPVMCLSSLKVLAARMNARDFLIQ